MKKLYIIGSSGFGKQILWLAKRVNEDSVSKLGSPAWDIVGFIDDNESLCGTVQDGFPVLGGCDYLGSLGEDVYVVIAIGSAKVKKIVAEKLSQYSNVKFATLIDPSAILSDRIKIGEGCLICARSILTVNVTIGNHVIINLDCTISHDAIVGDYVTVSPGVNITGNVNIGELAEIGVGTKIIQGKRIGKQSIIGAGAIVVKDIPERCTAVGTPAKPIKFFE